MPNTLDRIHLRPDNYVDAYALTGLTVGTALSIQSHSTKHCKIHIGILQPDLNPVPNPNDGSPYDPKIPVEAYVVLPPDYGVPVYIQAGEVGCWLLGDGPISIQEDV